MSQYTDKTLKDNNRRLLNLNRSEIEKVLPEYFTEDFPDLIQLFEAYYEYLDTNENFGNKIHDLNRNRDATQVSDDLLQYLEDELLLGQAYFGGFLNKREAVKFSNLLYRSKGTKYSIEQFFRGFFGVDPQVIYPKENVFTVGPAIDYDLNGTNNGGEQVKIEASQIGPESQRFITDDKLYQTLSVLIRVGIPVKDWIDVYKLFVHPAGFYLGSELLIEAVNTNILTTIQDAVGDPIEEGVAQFVDAQITPEAFAEVTFLNYTSIDHNEMQRQRIDQTFDDVGDYIIDSAQAGYADQYELLSASSPTMDDSDGMVMSMDSDGGFIALKPTFDQHRYDTLFDSAGNSADSAHYPLEHI